MATLVNYTCESFIKLTSGLNWLIIIFVTVMLPKLFAPLPRASSARFKEVRILTTKLLIWKTSILPYFSFLTLAGIRIGKVYSNSFSSMFVFPIWCFT